MREENQKNRKRKPGSFEKEPQRHPKSNPKKPKPNSNRNLEPDEEK